MGYKDAVIVWNAQGMRVEVLDLLPTDGSEMVDIPVAVGARKQVQARLIAKKMSEKVIKRRREQLKEQAHKQCKPIPPQQWELVQWTIVLTNVPLRLLAAAEAMALMRARWQIELLWKVWKDLGKVDEWQTENPERILCELYAKLLGMLVQHWLLLLSCWDDPHRSLVGAVQVIREQVPALVHGLTGHLPLGQSLRLVIHALKGGCSIPKRQTRLGTSHRLLEPLGRGLT